MYLITTTPSGGGHDGKRPTSQTNATNSGTTARRRQERRVQFRYRQAGLGAGTGRQTAGAAHSGLHLLAWHAAAALHAALFLRRVVEQLGPDPNAGAGRPPRYAYCPQAELFGAQRIPL